MLGKTSAFITHDFDEALLLADRIAIRKDGAVEQCDTPDQIVLNPATPYVVKFTEEIDKPRVIRARVLVQPGSAEGQALPADATLQGLARALASDPRPLVPLAEADGRRIGVLDRPAALDLIFGAAS